MLEDNMLLAVGVVVVMLRRRAKCSGGKMSAYPQNRKADEQSKSTGHEFVS